jgi:8-oxo-dGTP diphosphatase
MHTYDYPRPAVTVDAIVFWLQEQDLQVLLIKRKNDPFKGCWSFPGGFLDMEETPEAAAVRELEEETGLKVKDVVQIGAFGAPDRDPRHRTISIAFLSVLTEAPAEVKGADDASEACWFSLHDMPLRLAFDHKEMLQQAKVFTDMYFRTAMAGSDEAFQLSQSQLDQLLNHVS